MTDNLPPLPETVYGLFYEAQASDGDEGYQELVDEPAYTAAQMQAYARAAIEKDRERQIVPAGWKLVPIEPTDEWIARLESQQTGALEAVDADAIRQCIAELLAAAPQPQPVQEVEHCLWARNGNSRCPVPQAAQPLSDERLCEAMRKAADELLNHIYEFGTISEGVNHRLLAVGRSVEQAHGIKKGTT